MPLKVNIVGGGITGCVAALQCAELGAEVRLFEQGEKLGGVLQDIVHEGSHYYNGCQYFNTSSDWFMALRSSLDVCFTDFQHRYASVTELYDETSLNECFAQPVIHELPDITVQEEFKQNLVSRIRSYGKHSEQLLDWVKRFGKVENFHSDCSMGLQISRIFYSKDIEHTLSVKNSSTELEELLGVPRDILFPDSEIVFASLPDYGFNQTFEAIQQLLLSKGVEILFSSPVTPRAGHDAGLEISCRSKKLAADWTIWCANPTPLLIATQHGKLDSPFSKIYCLTANLITEQPLGTRYYQIFSNQSSILRIFHYTIANQQKISVEGLSEIEPVDSIVESTIAYLSKFGLNVRLDNISQTTQKRYTNFTENDFKKINTFNDNCISEKLIPGAWHLYGRDAKLAFIQGHIKNAFAK